ncbi:MAG: tRNA pseudouridine(55) synthase TruB [Acidimicrobiales bacterium]
MPGGPVRDGVVIVDKAPGWTSHDVVAKLRGVLGTKKVGHAGTLDPDATGVLVVGVGRMTRLLRFLAATTKSYTGEVVLGVATSTLDASGEVTGTWDMSGVTTRAARDAASGLTGSILQIPPMVSAVQIGGRRLHELAREGIEVERDARPVTVHSFEVGDPVAPGVLPIEVSCSAGTYVRTLAADLGAALGGGAHLRNLCRTAVGSFTIAEARPIEAIDVTAVRPMAESLGHLASIDVGDELAAAVRHGKVLPADVLGASGTGPWIVIGEAGELLAVYEAHKGSTVKPAVVVAAP